MLNKTNCKNTTTDVESSQVFDNQITGGGSRLLNPEELASFLNVKVKTIYGLVHRREIPFLKVGRLLRFNRQHIETWLSRR